MWQAVLSSMLAFLHMIVVGIACHGIIIISSVRNQCSVRPEVTGAFGGRHRFEYQEHCHGVQLVTAMIEAPGWFIMSFSVIFKYAEGEKL